MAEFRLHCDAISGNCYKVALALRLMGCDWEPVFVDYMAGATRQDGFRDRINELGEIPVLEHAGRLRTQSGAILTWLAARTGKFGGRNEDERYEILRWILFDNHKFTSYYATLRFFIGIQKTAPNAATEFLRGRAAAAYGIVDKHLATRPFLVGDAPTIADFSLAGYVYYTEETGIDRAAFPHIQAWRERIKALPGWGGPLDLMPGTKPA